MQENGVNVFYHSKRKFHNLNEVVEHTFINHRHKPLSILRQHWLENRSRDTLVSFDGVPQDIVGGRSYASK